MIECEKVVSIKQLNKNFIDAISSIVHDVDRIKNTLTGESPATITWSAESNSVHVCVNVGSELIDFHFLVKTSAFDSSCAILGSLGFDRSRAGGGVSSIAASIRPDFPPSATVVIECKL